MNIKSLLLGSDLAHLVEQVLHVVRSCTQLVSTFIGLQVVVCKLRVKIQPLLPFLSSELQVILIRTERWNCRVFLEAWLEKRPLRRTGVMFRRGQQHSCLEDSFTSDSNDLFPFSPTVHHHHVLLFYRMGGGRRRLQDQDVDFQEV